MERDRGTHESIPGSERIDWMRILPSPTSFGKMDLHTDLLPGIWTWPKDLQL